MNKTAIGVLVLVMIFGSGTVLGVMDDYVPVDLKEDITKVRIDATNDGFDTYIALEVETADVRDDEVFVWCDRIGAEMTKKNATHYLVSSLDDVAWLLNIRGADIPWTPLVLAFVLVGIEEIRCFIDDRKCPATVKDHFAESGVTILPYAAILF